MVPTFTLSGYRDTIAGVVSRGYCVRSFHDFAASERHLILRHDVDQSIALARQMADVESANGWSSTWFVLMRTEMYNPFSRSNTAHLREMTERGHEIGLHLDTTLYSGPDEVERGAQIECRMLEDVVGRPVRLVSFHRPSREYMGGSRPIAGRLHTYMDRFITDIGYCSDSRGEWRHGHPFDHAALRSGIALQLLTHAVWWVGADGRNAVERLEDVLELSRLALDRELAENNIVWRDARAGVKR